MGLLGWKTSSWAERLGVSDAELSDMIGSMMRTVGTQTSQQQNRVSELSAYGDAPETTRAARMRGAGYKGQMAVQKGTEGLQRYANQANRQAWQNIMKGKLQAKGIREGVEAQNWGAVGSMLGQIGSAAAMAAIL